MSLVPVLIAALAALVGTWIQMTDQLGRLSVTDPEGVTTFKTVEAWKEEHSSLRHPVRWFRNWRLAAQLLSTNPIEAISYRRTKRAAASWGLLVLASIITVAGIAWELLRALFA